MLRGLVENYKTKKFNFDKEHEKLDPVEDPEKETSIFTHLTYNVFIFVMALISLIVYITYIVYIVYINITVIMLLFKGAKMWALTTNLAMQKSVKVLTEDKENCSNYECWII